MLKSYIFDPVSNQTIIDLVDRTESEGLQNISADLSVYKNGVYYLIYSLDGETYVESIIKQ